MANALTRVVVDCSVVVTWKIPTEDHAAAAEALFGDWEHHVVDVLVPNRFPSEVISAILRASRRGRLTSERVAPYTPYLSNFNAVEMTERCTATGMPAEECCAMQTASPPLCARSRAAACGTTGNRLRLHQEKEEHLMKIVTIDEAQTQLPALLDAVEATGEPVLIYREGTPVADIMPHRTRSRLAPHPVMQQIRLDYGPTEPLTPDEWPESRQ